jgi:hypothetical protein
MRAKMTNDILAFRIETWSENFAPQKLAIMAARAMQLALTLLVASNERPPAAAGYFVRN